VSAVPRIASWALRSLAGQVRARGVPRQQIEAPARARHRALAHVSYWGFAFCLLLSVVAFFGALAVHHHGTWLSWVKIGFGIVLLVEGLVLARDWGGARRLLLWRLQERRKDQSTTELLSRSLLRRLLAPALGAIGVAWIGLGIVAIAFGVVKLV
jgi:hypothetical protein